MKLLNLFLLSLICVLVVSCISDSSSGSVREIFVEIHQGKIDSDISIISNFSSKISNSSKTIKESLINQMANKVRWKESINELEINNEKNLIEIGPGKVLSGLVKRITSSFNITSIDQLKDLELFK